MKKLLTYLILATTCGSFISATPYNKGNNKKAPIFTKFNMALNGQASTGDDFDINNEIHPLNILCFR